MITFLDTLAIVLRVVLILALAGMFAIAMDQIWGIVSKGLNTGRTRNRTGRNAKRNICDLLEKEHLRRQKEAEASEGFFEESYDWFLDSTGIWNRKVVKIPTTRAIHYYRLMDRLVDDQIFQNTEDL